ncbi:hypothetical protein [Clostridium beijerinckii]|uniref:Carboxypeptidase regulatory-like domain-containing protein n=1 Tax=Clostridium beijerinckii TaxID=1520 RepID=A0AAX0AX49_CLOBE|nr:hypothetical protein [Clostridium beijerinckii]MBA8934767.1 hypothetical protein [Clostridium beijerinckii]NOW04182.1 hypothetical protein [Clostridium beijerinckii]NRT35124.1 hypothetical protein [Clostridium beijerinckii]NRT45446.1 hypothetical protein [Clostridium beijerinckii]NRT71808.1 hypothetical protein [Clostridium beijerinckii]
MANYKPKTMVVPSSDANSGLPFTQKISTNTWGMFLLKGTALSPSGAAMGSGAVQVWESTRLTTDPADHTTFTDASGRYGVTCRAKTQLRIKFFGK